MTIRPILDPIDTQQLENVNYNFGFLFNYVRALSGGADIEALLDRINLAIANGEALNTQSQELIDELTPLLSQLNDALAEVGNLSYIGVWDGVTTYEKLNIVSYNGESYIAKRSNTNITPVEGDDWGTISQRGQQGIQGEQGEPGQGLIILGLLPNAAALPSTAQPGDAYLVQGTPFNTLYVWVGGAFVDMGPFGSSSDLEKATQAEAIAGTNNDKYMTPLRVSEAVTPHFTQLEFQTPTISGTQIILSKPSNSNRLFFRLSAALSGPITVSTDGGTTSRNLVNDEDVQLTTLDKGFYEIVLTGSFFTLRNKGGLSQADLDALITLTNEAEVNDSTLRSEYVTEVNSLGVLTPLDADSTWNQILLKLPEINFGKKRVASGIKKSGSSTISYALYDGSGTVPLKRLIVPFSEIGFIPTRIDIRRQVNANTVNNTSYYKQYADLPNYILVYSSNRVSVLNDYNAIGLNGNIIVSELGFYLPVADQEVDYEWFAYE